MPFAYERTIYRMIYHFAMLLLSMFMGLCYAIKINTQMLKISNLEVTVYVM